MNEQFMYYIAVSKPKQSLSWTPLYHLDGGVVLTCHPQTAIEKGRELLPFSVGESAKAGNRFTDPNDWEVGASKVCYPEAAHLDCKSVKS